MSDLIKKRRVYAKKIKLVRFVVEILNFVGADENLRYGYYLTERNIRGELFLIDEKIAKTKERFCRGFMEGFRESYTKKLDGDELLKLNEIIETSFNKVYGLDGNEEINDSYENEQEALIEGFVDEIVKLALDLVLEK